MDAHDDGQTFWIGKSPNLTDLHPSSAAERGFLRWLGL